MLASPLPEGLHLALWFAGDMLAAIDFVGPEEKPWAENHLAVSEAVRAVQHYFADPQGLQLPPLALTGTPFQQRVWQALCAIPSGQTRSYGELAAQLGSAARAVAGACRANPVPLLVPCHRVVAARGFGGYMGQTAGPALAIKRWLLQHEQHAG